MAATTQHHSSWSEFIVNITRHATRLLWPVIYYDRPAEHDAVPHVVRQQCRKACPAGCPWRFSSDRIPSLQCTMEV